MNRAHFKRSVYHFTVMVIVLFKKRELTTVEGVTNVVVNLAVIVL